ncbi:MAG TPA: HAMP domain-containing sensor histidine kinase [Alphaproteobacteria bacterium]|nr:HAMP domain-containing sensor histidine kinase [Alphaproteobacteria bacterium]
MRLHLFRTSTFRFALVYVGLFATSALLLLGFIYVTTAGYASRQTDEVILAQIAGLAEQYRQRGLDGVATTIAQRAARNPRGHAVYLLADPARRRIVGNLDRWPREAVEPGWVEFLIEDPDTQGEAYRARAQFVQLAGGFHLLVGQDVQEQQRHQTLMISAMAWGGALTLALALIGGLLMSRATLQRVETINRASREIIRGDLSRRMPTRGTGDEFDQLAENLNAMLDQIARLMDGIRQVSDNIAHDLRTPLTRLRSRLEAARLSQADPAMRATIDELIADADALLSTFNALLRIAEIEAGRRRAAFEAVDLAEIARDAVELYEPVAQDKRQTIAADLASGAVAKGDRHLLAQAVANLLDNAIKYSPEGARIAVTTTVLPAGPVLSVADNGPGIPAEFRDKAVRRFFRLETSRSTPGTGLGLSLVSAVAKLHGARLALEDNAPGLRVTLAFEQKQGGAAIPI